MRTRLAGAFARCRRRSLSAKRFVLVGRSACVLIVFCCGRRPDLDLCCLLFPGRPADSPVLLELFVSDSCVVQCPALLANCRFDECLMCWLVLSQIHQDYPSPKAPQLPCSKEDTILWSLARLDLSEGEEVATLDLSAVWMLAGNVITLCDVE